MNDQRLTSEQPAGILAARGSVREGLAALQNFENLLRSPRIGPRSVGKMVGELRSSCGPIAHALGVLIDEIALREPSEGVAVQLADCARTSMQQLDSALVRADQREVGARARLALESEVRRVSVDLGTLRGLIDLLDLAGCGRSTELEVRELLEASINALCKQVPVQARQAQVLAVVPARPVSVMTHPRVAMQLVGIGVGLVAASGAPAVRVDVAVHHEQAAIRMTATSTTRDCEPCAVPSIIGPSAEVARLASRALGGAFVVRAGGCELALPSPLAAAGIASTLDQS